jgi:hypothetical protein
MGSIYHGRCQYTRAVVLHLQLKTRSRPRRSPKATDITGYIVVSVQDCVTQTSIKFKSQLNLKCTLFSCTFQVHVHVISFGHCVVCSSSIYGF